MWNKLLAIWCEPSSKRLAAALLVSVLLHAWLMGGLHLSLPANQDSTVIEARLQPPVPAKKVVQEIPTSSPPPSPKKAKPPKPQAVPPPPQLDPEPPTPTTAQPPPADVQNPETPAPEVASAESEPLPQAASDEGVIINEHPYDYVETYFDIRTKIDGPIEGKAKSVFDIQGEQYRLDFIAEPGGMAGLLLPDLIQVSQGIITKTGLQPLLYTYQFGTNQDKSRRATFNWAEKSLTIETAKENKTVPLMEDAQDVISFMYQFMYVAPLQKMQLNITNGKSFREYDYDFVGEETLKLGQDQIQAYHIVHNNTENDEKVELWLSENYQFLPVKIRKIDKTGKVYEFSATKLNTARPSNER